MTIRRVLLYGLGWVAAAAVAVVLAWQGVDRVGSGITDRHARPLTADEARAALGAAPGPAGPQPSPAPSDGSTAGSGPGVGATTTTTRGRPTTTPSTRQTPTTTRPSLAPPPPTPPQTGNPTTTTTAAGVVRTYNLVGGSATLRFDPSGKVTVVWADPNPGYRVEVDNRSDGGVRIRFDGSSHRSELEAWWDGGPQDHTEESGGGGDGGSGPG